MTLHLCYYATEKNTLVSAVTKFLFMKFSKGFFFFLLVPATVISTGCTKNYNDVPAPATPAIKVMVTTLAGDGTDGYGNGTALAAKFSAPIDVAVASDGTVYVADYLNHRIRKIANGQVTTFAGNQTRAILDDMGEAASFKDPYRIAVDADNNVYVLDQSDPRIRKISPGAVVTTYAGTDQPGFLNGGSLIAQFALNAEGIVTDGQGNVYVGDTFNNRIRKIGTSAQVSTLSGDGKEGLNDGNPDVAEFRFPDGITIDNQGNLYVIDNNFYIRKITPAGVVSRFAGSGVQGRKDGNRDEAQFYSIGDIVADSHGNLYVSDDNTIRKITPDGTVSTIAGNGTRGYADGDGPTARFKDIIGLGIDVQGNIYAADVNNNRIRKISFP